MDDFIILPDGKTMEKLAAEYGKVKAKTFSDSGVTALSAQKLKPLKIVVRDFDCMENRAELDGLIELYSESIVILRRLGKLSKNTAAKDALLNLSIKKREGLESVMNTAVYNNISVKTTALRESDGFAALKRDALKNSELTLAALDKLCVVSARTDAKRKFEKLYRGEIKNALSLISALL